MSADKSPVAFRTISEVAEELDVPQHVLRFWETRFAHIKPLKRGGGRRYYRPDDVDLIRGIRHLLYGEGYTIRGVQRILKEEGVRFVQMAWQGGMLPGQNESGYPSAGERLEGEAHEDWAEDAATGRHEPFFDERGEPASRPQPDEAYDDEPLFVEGEQAPQAAAARAADLAQDELTALWQAEPTLFSAELQPRHEERPHPAHQARRQPTQSVEAHPLAPAQRAYAHLPPQFQPPGFDVESRQVLEDVLAELMECRRLLLRARGGEAES